MNYYTDVLKKYTVFDGRAARKEYWMFFLMNTIVSFIVSIIDGILSLGFLSTLYALAVLLPSLALGARRLHDIGKSGWWLLLALIPFIGWLVLLIFALMDSQPGDNQYGPNPKGSVPPASAHTPTPVQ